MASGNRLSAQNVDMLKSEMDSCAQNCKHTILFPGYIPTRLLFVGTDDGGDSQLRLETREEVMANVNWVRQTELTRYAALSYCWGPPEDARQQCKTEGHSIRAWRQSIPDQCLSPVVRDAVMVARRLNICYLWVDALCIAQDDVDDWQKESPLMGPVYSNAYITIIPLNSSTCQKGFLEYQSGGVSPDGQVPGPAVNLFTDWRAAGWSRRGWVFQEEKLSTRAVYIGPTRIYFCCSNYIRAADDPERGLVLEKSIFHIANDPPASETAAQSLMRFWESNIVPQFSHREFSRSEDKLVAIASLAKYIGDFTGYDYAAGIWIPRLHIELAWHYKSVHTGLEDLVRALHLGVPSYIAPSWSWGRFATMERLRFFMYVSQKQQLRLEPEAQFELPFVDTVGPNRYGQVRYGSLQLKTKVMRLPPGYDMSNKTRRGGREVFLLDWSGDEGDSDSTAKLELILIGHYSRQNGTQKQLYGIIAYPRDVFRTYYRVGLFDLHIFPQSVFHEFESTESRTVTIV